MRGRVLTRGFGVLVALAVSLGLATSGAAQPPVSVSCPKWTAEVSSGQVGMLQWDSSGNPTTPTAVTGKLKEANPYLAESKVTFEYGHNRYVLTKGTGFNLGCYGQNKNHPHTLYARVGLTSGSGTVFTSAATPGALYTWQALMNPVGHTAQRISVSVKGLPTNGTMTMHATGPIIDITPELGTSAGHCIYHHALVVHSHWSEKLQMVVMDVTVLS